jgi:hypothetical protein
MGLDTDTKRGTEISLECTRKGPFFRCKAVYGFEGRTNFSWAMKVSFPGQFCV